MGCGRIVTAQDVRQIRNSLDTGKTDVAPPDDPTLKQALEEAMEPLDTQALKEAAKHYEIDEIAEIVHVFGDSPGYVNAIVGALNEVANVGITGMEKVVQDLMMGGKKAQGAERQLDYILKHKSEIAEIEVPKPRFGKDDMVYGVQGPDIINRDGSAVELKNYNFQQKIYESKLAEKIAENAVKQARGRVENEGAPHATIVFSGEGGAMPAEFKAALDKAIGSDTRIDWRVE